MRLDGLCSKLAMVAVAGLLTLQPCLAQTTAAERWPHLPIPHSEIAAEWETGIRAMLVDLGVRGQNDSSRAASNTIRTMLSMPRSDFGDSDDIVGEWRVRSMQVNQHGADVYDFFPSSIYPEARVLNYDKRRGSQLRMGMLLQDLPDRYFFLGAEYRPGEWGGAHSSIRQDPTDEHRALDSEGFLFMLGPRHMIMVFRPKNGRGEIYELLR